MQILTIEDFIKFPKVIFKCTGWNLYQEKFKIWQKCFLIFMNCNMVISMGILGMNIVSNLHDSSKFLEIISTSACMGFLTLCLVKAYGVIYRNKNEISEVLSQLDDFLPKNRNLQIEQNIPEILTNLYRMMIIFFTIYSGSVALFNLMPVFIIVYGKFVQGIQYDLQLPYKAWYPFDINNNFNFFISYFLQTWASFTSLFFVAGTDLLFCVCITLLCIRFDKLKLEIESISFVKDLKKCVETHNQLIKISERLDEIFSPSILFNIFAASFIICFTGFQVTVCFYFQINLL
jgi:odorant receptor